MRRFNALRELFFPAITDAVAAAIIALPVVGFAQTFSLLPTSMPGVDVCEVVWGDYDNDNDLDVLLTGGSSDGLNTKIFRNNGDGTFTDAGAALIPMSISTAAWGDLDNDGDLDIIETGNSSTDIFANSQTAVFVNDGAGNFVSVPTSLQGTNMGSLALAYCDLDGKLDVMVANSGASIIYRNNGTFDFGTTLESLPGILSGGSAFGDYDNDGDSDLFLTGGISTIFNNDGAGHFAASVQGLETLIFSTGATGDFDGNGQPDLLLAGRDLAGDGKTILYQNLSGNMTTVTATGLVNVQDPAMAWGDCDNDGDSDILLMGSEPSKLRTSKIYKNNGDGTFTDIAAGLDGAILGSASWGDYDNDGDLDIVLAGRGSAGTNIARIYTNNSAIANTPPVSPAGLTAQVLSSTAAQFNWDSSTDAQTSTAALTYNLRVGTSPGASDVLSPMANPSTGFRLIAAAGNTNNALSRTVTGLTAGTTYYWSVQTIDAGFAGSSFAAEQSFALDAAVDDWDIY